MPQVREIERIVEKLALDMHPITNNNTMLKLKRTNNNEERRDAICWYLRGSSNLQIELCATTLAREYCA